MTTSLVPAALTEIMQADHVDIQRKIMKGQPVSMQWKMTQNPTSCRIFGAGLGLLPLLLNLFRRVRLCVTP